MNSGTIILKNDGEYAIICVSHDAQDLRDQAVIECPKELEKPLWDIQIDQYLKALWRILDNTASYEPEANQQCKPLRLSLSISETDISDEINDAGEILSKVIRDAEIAIRADGEDSIYSNYLSYLDIPDVYVDFDKHRVFIKSCDDNKDLDLVLFIDEYKINKEEASHLLKSSIRELKEIGYDIKAGCEKCRK